MTLGGIEAIEEEMMGFRGMLADGTTIHFEGYAARLKAERERIEPFFKAAMLYCGADDPSKYYKLLMLAYRALASDGEVKPWIAKLETGKGG